ncbi:CHASE3 domain-containing protein [soil metagenome]
MLSFMVALAALLLIAILSVTAFETFSSATRWVAHSNEVLKGTGSVLSLIQDVETGGRGYFITGRPVYLEPYKAAQPAVMQKIDELAALTSGDTRQRDDLVTLRRLASTKMEQEKRIIDSRTGESTDLSHQLITSDEAKATMDSLRAVVARILGREEGILQSRLESRRQTYITTLVLTLGGFLFSLCLLTFATVVIKRDLGRRRAVEADLRRARDELEGRVQEGTHSLAAESVKHAATLAHLETAAARYRLLVSNFPAGVVLLFDEQLRLMLMDGANVPQLPLRTTEIEGKTLAEVFPEDAFSSVVPLFQAALEGRSTTVEVPLKQRQYLVNTLPVRDRAGRVIAGMSIMQDITDRRVIEDELRHARKMDAVGKLAGGVAHDFNNLLMVLRFHAAKLTADLGEGNPSYPDAIQIERVAERAVALTNQLLTVSRRQPFAPVRLEMNQAVGECVNLLSRTLGARIHFDWRPNLVSSNVMIDRSQLEQVVMNLCINARDSMPDGGTLSVTLSALDYHRVRGEIADKGFGEMKPGAYVCLSVKDSGHGMDARTLEHIFEPFFTTKDVGKGTGLGLSTVYGIVQQNAGHITVHSEPGAGTEFCVYFPRLADVPRAGGAPYNPPEGDATGAGEPGIDRKWAPGVGKNVLLAEDHPQVSALVISTLKGAGFNVLAASDGAAALKLAQEHGGPIDLLVTDMVMPEMTGSLLGQKVRALHPNIPIVFMSGYTETTFTNLSSLPVNSEFLPKPFVISALLEAIDRVLRSVAQTP